MEREKIILNSENHHLFCREGYITVNDEIIDFEEVEDKYISSGRHCENWYIINRRLSDGKYFKSSYSVSVKDEMGWSDCNWHSTYIAEEVFPKEVTTVIYE